MALTSTQIDRVGGVLLAAACADALGVPYEPAQRGPADGSPRMLGGGYGDYDPGEYSDDTQMAVVIAEVAATGLDLRSEEALDRIALGFVRDWFGGGATDVGVQTRAVLTQAAQRLGPAAVPPPPDGVKAPHPDPNPSGSSFEDPVSVGLAALLRELSAVQHASSGRTAGNGSLMRTSPVALAHLGDPTAIVAAARAVSALTHHDPVAGDACALWCLAIDHAVRTGDLDVRVGLPQVSAGADGATGTGGAVPTGGGTDWAARLDAAEAGRPEDFASASGWVVAALQQAWSAIWHTRHVTDPTDRLVAGVERAIQAGGDTDTVAAIAGALLGAVCGAGAVPEEWRQQVHGWPGLHADGLVDLALRCARV